jgi:hypothetical protein
VYHPDADCDFTGQPCGQIDINRKPADPAGSGTHVYDNITTDIGFNSGSTGSSDHNLSGQNVTFFSATSPLTHDSYVITAPSTALIGASDGTAIGVSKLGSTPPPPSCTKQPDINCDNAVNVTDLSILLSNYGKTTTQLASSTPSYPRADINSSGKVDIGDLSALLTGYGK